MAKSRSEATWIRTGLSYGAAHALAAAIRERFLGLAVCVGVISEPNWYGVALVKGRASLVEKARDFADGYAQGLKDHYDVEAATEENYRAWRRARCETCVHLDQPCAACVARVQGEKAGAHPCGQCGSCPLCGGSKEVTA